MKKLSLLLILIAVILSGNQALAQEKKEEGYQFTNDKVAKYTSVKNQNRSGTCWSYSGLGFLECELLRKGKGEHDLADMWIVAHAYRDKADMYVRMHGEYNFSAGGAFFDVLNVYRKHGIVPEEIYTGNGYGEVLPVHGELDAILKSYVDVIVKNPNKKLSTAWKTGYSAVVDTYLGKAPETFTYNGVTYTPQSYAASLGLNMDDYISITSFTHHPFYTKFAIEVPDNWAMEQSYNLPLDEFMQVMNNAVDNGYTFAWGSDVSHKGFNFRKGVAIIPDKDFSASEDGSDRARWEKLSQNDRDKELYSFDKPGKEKVITQEFRQEEFDNFTTTDDHGMVIVGRAKDQNGTPYFIVKNSWGTTTNPYDGMFYASEAFVALQTLNIVIHKDALPKAIKNKLGIK